jgi:HSP20 family molecular chaperone IbpA
MQTREQLPTLFVELQKLIDPSCFWNVHQSDIAGLTMFENDDFLFLETAVPGVKSDQIEIFMEKGIVWIKAEAPQQLPKDVKVHVKMDRKYSYRIPLPVKIDEQHAPEAECKDGVVTVKIAKSRSSKPLKINVK